MSAMATFHSHADDVLMAVNALLHRELLLREFVSFVAAMYDWPKFRGSDSETARDT
jgi:hypothetical protein